MRASRIVALIAGCLMLLPGIGLLFGGGGLGMGYAFGRNEAGYFEMTINDLRSPTAAITAESPALTYGLGGPAWLTEAMDVDVRLRVGSDSSERQIFVGIGPEASVDSYLGTVAHDEITSLTKGRAPTYRTSNGSDAAVPPAAQTFWAATTSSLHGQQLSWHATGSQWAVVVMNSDGSPGIAGNATVEVRAGVLLPLALTLLGFGLLITAAAIVLIVIGASGRPATRKTVPADSPDTAWTAGPSAQEATADRPVVLTAELDSGLSRWRWLIKWFLAIPHFVVLSFLWPAFAVVTLIAGFSILFTGVYPRSLFEFNRGVLRWSWRVSYYALNGGLGTDWYPPFTLGPVPGYPATLDIAYPATLSRGLVLVKWWLLAIPHYVILGLLVSNWWAWSSTDNDRFGFDPMGSGGVLGLLVVIAACILLVTGKYPKSLFDLIIGFNRWIYRVVAYSALMTDQYPPFRLDQGGSEPTTPPHQPYAGPGDPRTVEPVGTRGGA